MGEWKAVIGMLEQLPIRPETLAADTACNAGRLRQHLEDLGFTAYIPIHPNQEANMVARGGFNFRGDHLLCPQDKRLRRSTFHNRDRIYQCVARQKDYQQCPVKTDCLQQQQKRRYVALSMYHPAFLRARERNDSDAYKREMTRRKTVAEGVFTSLDRLGWEKCKLRGLWKVDCEGYMAALARNFKKAMRKLGGSGPPAYRHEGALAAA